LLSRARSGLDVEESFFSVSVVQRRGIVNNVFQVPNYSCPLGRIEQIVEPNVFNHARRRYRKSI
jgi:hypothetical protein